MADTTHQAEALKVARSLGYPDLSITDYRSASDFGDIWNGPSAAYAGDTANAGQGFVPHGVPSRAKAVLLAEEIPEFARNAFKAAGLMALGGGLTIAGAQFEENQGVRVAASAAGGVEFGGGVAYGTGALVLRQAAKNGGQAMATLGRFGGLLTRVGQVAGGLGAGVAGMILSGASLMDDSRRNDVPSAAIHGMGMVGTFFLGLGLITGLGGLALLGGFMLAMAAGYDLGRLFR
jgi:hypothetical protein